MKFHLLFPPGKCQLQQAYHSTLAIRKTERPEDAELVLCMADDVTEEILDAHAGRLCAIEKLDGANIKHKKMILDGRLKYLVKSYCYQRASDHDLPCVDGRIFTRALALESQWKPPRISLAEHSPRFDDVVRLGLNFIHYPRMEALLSVQPKRWRDRQYDVFFAGTVEYGKHDHESGLLIAGHRKKLARILTEMKGFRTLSLCGRALPHHEYLAAMCDSRVVISPWGWGEACYRDYEAKVCGAALLKPWLHDVIGCHPPLGVEIPDAYINPWWRHLEDNIACALSRGEAEGPILFTDEDIHSPAFRAWQLEQLLGKNLCEYPYHR